MDTRPIDLKAGVWAGHDVDLSRFFALVETEQNITVRLSKDAHGSGAEIAEDRGAGYKEIAKTDAGRFGRVDFLSAVDQTIVYGVSERDVVDDTIFGEVKVNGVVKVDPLAQKESPAYSVYGNSGSEAGRYSHWGVMNPAGSGKKVVVWQANVETSEASGMFFTLMRNYQATAEAMNGFSYGSFVKHEEDSPNPVARRFWARPSVLVNTTIVAFAGGAPAGGYLYRPNRPLVLEEGDCFMVGLLKPNVDVYANGEIEEVDA